MSVTSCNNKYNIITKYEVVTQQHTYIYLIATSLVNQPYFSCAHISQSAHAHNEGAEKIRLAKPAGVLSALAEICQQITNSVIEFHGGNKAIPAGSHS